MSDASALKAPAKPATGRKLVRFLSVMGVAPSKGLLDDRIAKIQFELDRISAVADAVDRAGGISVPMRDSLANLAGRLATIRASSDDNKKKRTALGELKADARTAAAQAEAGRELAIEAGQQARSELEATNRRLRTAADTAIARAEASLAGAPGIAAHWGEQVVELRRRYAEAVRQVELRAANAALAMMPGQASILDRNIGIAKTCVEPARAATHWVTQLQTAVAGLPAVLPDAEPRPQDAALRARTAELATELAEAGETRIDRMRDAYVAVADAASVAYEAVRKAAIAGTLPADKLAANGALDMLAAGLRGHEDLESQATMRAAIALRFGVAFATSDAFANPLGSGIKKLDQLYEVLAMVPGTHLAARSGTMQLSYKEARRGEERDNRFAKRELPDQGGEVHTIVLTLPVDGERITKRNAAATETELSFFTTTALHEIGHAVDDAEGFMAAHRTGVGFGQWAESSMEQTRDRHVEALAACIGIEAEQHPALRSYVEDCLKGITPARPAGADAPGGGLLPHWDALAAPGEMLRGLRSTEGLWYKRAAGADAATVGDRVYFEAYPGQWWSFVRRERDASVADYQWRAPGEWFAEAYALFYLGHLPETHPVAVWCRSQPPAGS